MGRIRELKALPSMAELPDGDMIAIREMPAQEWERYQRRMAENLEERMKYYYMQHPEERMESKEM